MALRVPLPSHTAFRSLHVSNRTPEGAFRTTLGDCACRTSRPRLCAALVSRLLNSPPCGPRRAAPAGSGVRASSRLIHVSTSEPPAPEEAPEEARVAALVESLKWDSTSGLVVAIAQNADTGDVMMQGFADRRAVAKTLLTGRATFFSRSRKSLWTKGESSGNFIQVLDVYVDCDRDTLIYLGLPDGPTCHTMETTCFFDKLRATEEPRADESKFPLSSLFAVEHTVLQRQQEMLAAAEAEAGPGGGAERKKPSWTQRLLSDAPLLCSKIREEADELCRTLVDNEGMDRTASEMADLLYHTLVLLRVQGVSLEEVAGVLRSRFGKSGIEEKASRKPKATS